MAAGDKGPVHTAIPGSGSLLVHAVAQLPLVREHDAQGHRADPTYRACLGVKDSKFANIRPGHLFTLNSSTSVTQGLSQVAKYDIRVNWGSHT